MEYLLNTFQSVFDFFTSLKIAGLSLTNWIVITIVISAIGLFIRGNK